MSGHKQWATYDTSLQGGLTSLLVLETAPPLFHTGSRLLYVEASFSYSKQELLPTAVHRPLGAWASIVAPQHVRSFWTRDWTRDPYTGRQTLNPWTPSEVSRDPHLQDWDPLHLCGHATYPCLRMPACVCRQQPHSPGLQGDNSPL